MPFHIFESLGPLAAVYFFLISVSAAGRFLFIVQIPIAVKPAEWFDGQFGFATTYKSDDVRN